MADDISTLSETGNSSIEVDEPKPKGGLFSQFVNRGKVLDETKAALDAANARVAELEADNAELSNVGEVAAEQAEKIGELEAQVAQLQADKQEISELAAEMVTELEKQPEKVADAVEDVVAELGVAAADLPDETEEPSVQQMTKEELWGVYNKLPVEKKNEFYREHRAVLRG